MSEERRRVLAMLAEGTITVDDAERLLAAVGEPAAEGAPGGASAQTPRRKPKYLRDVKPEDLDELLDSLTELSVDVNDEKEKVRIYTE